MDSLTAAERETVVTTSDAAETVHVWTAQRATITRLRRDPAFTETDNGTHGTTPWATFETNADRWTPAGVKRRRAISDTQRAEVAERLQAARAAGGAR